MELTDLSYLFALSVFTFLLYGWDKFLAVCGRRRVPEAVLLVFAFVGGAFGALCGMIFFNHKTRHTAFLVCVPLALVLVLTVDILLRLFVF